MVKRKRLRPNNKVLSPSIVKKKQKKKGKKKKKRQSEESWKSSSSVASSSPPSCSSSDHHGTPDHEDSSQSDHDRYNLRRNNDNHFDAVNSSNKQECSIRKSPRKSILKTTRKIHDMVRRDSDSDDDDDDVNQQEYSDQDGDEDIRTFKATKKQRLMEGDDDSYRENESEVEKEDEDFDDDDVENEERDLFNDEMSFENDVESSSDDDEIVKNRTRTTDKASMTPSKTRNINNDDIFDKEEDSNDDDDGGNANRSPMKSVPLTPLKFKKIGQFRYESSEDEKEIIARSVKDGVPKDDESVELPETPKKIPLCTSEFDEITNERLPPLHVCYLAPDGKSRHCFCLETLYRAAILSGSKTRKDDGSGGLCFLQPPHFRTVMEDTLIDQIASRFGRQALVIENSTVYKDESKRKAIQTRYDIDDDEEVILSFRRRFNNYLNRQMGSGDIYCCPLCYTEAQRRFREGDDGSDDDDESENDDDSDNDKSGKGDSNHNDDDDEFEYNMDTVTSYTQIDPMSILGSLDHDEFEVAACFCFHKLSQVKNHVRVIHNIDTSNVEVNDFFKRFMIRAQDGLLQRYLRAFWKHRIFAGAMRKYWFEGHNQNYILLRVVIDHREYMNEIDHGFTEDHFCKSFQRRAVKIWRGLSAPYSRLCESDFIDSGEEDIEEIPHPIFEPPPEDVEGAFVEHLRKKIQSTQGRKHGYDTSSSDDDDDGSKEGSDDDEDEVIFVDGGDDEDIYVEESSEDDWMASKRAKKRDESKRIKKGRFKHNKDGLSGSEDDEVFVRPNTKSIARKVATQLSSSDDESDSDEQSLDEKRSSHDEQSSDDHSRSSDELKVRNTPSKKVTILDSDDD